MANPRRGPSHALLEEAEGVLQVETPDVRTPDEIEVRHHPLRPVPPQPQNPRLPPTLAPWQTLYLETRMSVPTTIGKGPRLPRPSFLWTLGCSFSHARTRTH